jgi:hypothetical protein
MYKFTSFLLPRYSCTNNPNQYKNNRLNRIWKNPSWKNMYVSKVQGCVTNLGKEAGIIKKETMERYRSSAPPMVRNTRNTMSTKKAIRLMAIIL